MGLNRVYGLNLCLEEKFNVSRDMILLTLALQKGKEILKKYSIDSK